MGGGRRLTGGCTGCPVHPGHVGCRADAYARPAVTGLPTPLRLAPGAGLMRVYRDDCGTLGTGKTGGTRTVGVYQGGWWYWVGVVRVARGPRQRGWTGMVRGRYRAGVGQRTSESHPTPMIITTPGLLRGTVAADIRSRQVRSSFRHLPSNSRQTHNSNDSKSPLGGWVGQWTGRGTGSPQVSNDFRSDEN